MESRARIADHPLHPMLIIVPAGAFVATLVFDLVYIAGGNALWWAGTLPLTLVGVLGGLVAAVPGFIDLISVATKQNATKIGVTHMVLNLVIVALFAWNSWLRWSAPAAPEPGAAYFPFWLTLVGAGLLLVSGWLGWSMVYRYHVGVLEHPQAQDPPPGAMPRTEAAD